MTTEWATSTSVTVTIPSADSDDSFNAALDELAAIAREYGQGDNRRVVAVEVDLVEALRSTRASLNHAGKDSPFTIDRVLHSVIGSYIFQIESEWA